MWSIQKKDPKSSNNLMMISELRVTQLVRFLVVKPLFLSSNPQLGMGGHIFLDLFQDLIDAIILGCDW